jgi:hypothetical protein
MTGLNALLMSDTEVLITLAIFAAVCVMLMGTTRDVTRAGRVGVRIAVCAALGLAAVAGLAWSSIPAPHVTAAIVAAAGG